MTHLIATLASIRKLLTVRHGLPSAEPRKGYGGVPVSAPETRQPSRQKLVQPRWRELGAELSYVPLRLSANDEPLAASSGRSDRRPDFEHSGCRAYDTSLIA